MTIDRLWDFDDPVSSEGRFRERLATATGDERLELLTQVARAQGLQRRFDDAHRTLDEVERNIGTAAPRVRVRLLLERGRVYRSGGSGERAIPPFSEALERATDAREAGLAVDAAHMLAITVSDPAERMAWHERGIAMAEATEDPSARRWLPSLRNNLGWSHLDAGRHAEALDQFERALGERRAGGDPKATRIAEWAVARALRALGRLDDALAMQRRLLEEWRAEGGRPPYVNEELGECLLALGRETEARPYFAEAYALLSADQGLAASQPERLARIGRLAGVMT